MIFEKTISLKQEEIYVDIDFYDEVNREILLASSKAEEVLKLVGSGLKVPLQNF